MDWVLVFVLADGTVYVLGFNGASCAKVWGPITVQMFAYRCVCAPCAYRVPEEALGPLELELGWVGSCPVDAGKCTKNCKSSNALSH